MSHDAYKERWKNKEIGWLHANTSGHRKYADKSISQETKDHYRNTGRDYNVQNVSFQLFFLLEANASNYPRSPASNRCLSLLICHIRL